MAKRKTEVIQTRHSKDIQAAQDSSRDMLLLADTTRGKGLEISDDGKIFGLMAEGGGGRKEGKFVEIKDVMHNPVDIMYTTGLIGCAGVAILGKTSEGKIDVFFAHIGEFQDESYPPSHPMSKAKKFVDEHSEVRVLHGSGTAGAKINEDRRVALCRGLGCWVRDSDFANGRCLVFFPKLGIASSGLTLKEAVDSREFQNRSALEMDISFGDSKWLRKFTPNKALEDGLQLQAELKKPRGGYSFTSKRTKEKSEFLEKTKVAYACGDYDTLREAVHRSEHWSKPGTSALVIQGVCKDACEKISAMQPGGCGLDPSGRILQRKEYSPPAAVPSPPQGLDDEAAAADDDAGSAEGFSRA